MAKFYVRSTSVWENPDKIIQYYPCLHDFGFDIQGVRRNFKTRIRDEHGEIIFQEGYDIKRFGVISVNTIEQLLLLKERVKCELIIDMENEENWIEIYDGYRE